MLSGTGKRPEPTVARTVVKFVACRAANRFMSDVKEDGSKV